MKGTGILADINGNYMNGGERGRITLPVEIRLPLRNVLSCYVLLLFLLLITAFNDLERCLCLVVKPQVQARLKLKKLIMPSMAIMSKDKVVPLY